MENNRIEIVDRGRGLQLSTCRITVQDVVPYVQQGYTHEQIQQIMPILSLAEIEAIEQYIQEHHAAVMAQDKRIRERAAARRPSPEAAEAERAAMRQRLDAARSRIHLNKQELKSDRASC